MPKKNHSIFMLASIGAMFSVGCGTALPPKELVTARENYKRASAGPAKELAPAELDTAKQSLARAEGAFQNDPEAPRTRDLAYIADRKAQLSESAAAIEAAERKRTAAEKDYRELSGEELASAREALKSGKQELESERKARLEAEKARKEAERTAAAALKSLAEIAKVKEEARGVVITLSGAVLFASGKSELLPIAKDQLRKVATTLKDQGAPPLLIEGHTDSTGSATQNRELSLARADSVKSYLVSEGFPAAKITTAGLGPDRPIADNSSAEGRANNRRVEIVVNPK